MQDFASKLVFEHGENGIAQYEKLHRNKNNQIIHMIGMPFVVYSMFILIPSLFDLYYLPGSLTAVMIFGIYVVYYASFNTANAICNFYFYLPSLLFAISSLYNPYPYFSLYALALFTVLMVIQELIGHTFFEHANSNLYELPNSIVFAPAFATKVYISMMYNIIKCNPELILKAWKEPHK
jgi:uncharacterized membrane protein YGL010W